MRNAMMIAIVAVGAIMAAAASQDDVITFAATGTGYTVTSESSAVGIGGGPNPTITACAGSYTYVSPPGHPVTVSGATTNVGTYTYECENHPDSMNGVLTVITCDPVPPLPEPRYDPGAARIGTDLYVVGGADGGFNDLTSVIKYNGTGNWTEAESLPEQYGPIFNYIVIAYQDNIYVLGGANTSDSNRYIADVVVFDGTTWTQGAPLNLKTQITSSVLYRDKLYASQSCCSALTVYDGNAWTTFNAPGVVNGVVAATADNLYIFGDVGNKAYNGSDWIDIADGGHSTNRIVEHNGLIYKIGGLLLSTIRDAVSVYDPATDTWLNTPALAEPRNKFAAVVYNHQILAIGGHVANHVISNSVEVVPAAPSSCGAAITLVANGTMNATTVGRRDTIDRTCGTGPEQVFVATVQEGEKFMIRVLANDFDSVVDLRVGGSCPGEQLVCVDDDDDTPFLYTNDGASNQTVYFIVSGFEYDAGAFTIEWDISKSAVCPSNYDGPILFSTCTTTSCAGGVRNLVAGNCQCGTPDDDDTYDFDAPFMCASECDDCGGNCPRCIASCDAAIQLGPNGTMNATTVGRRDIIDQTCGTGPEQVFVATVQQGEKFMIGLSDTVIGLSDTEWTVVADLRVGGSCPGVRQEVCADTFWDGRRSLLYTNDGTSTQTVYVIVNGWKNAGAFTIEWDISASAECPSEYDGPILYSTCTHSCGGDGDGSYNLFNGQCQCGIDDGSEEYFESPGTVGGGFDFDAPFMCASECDDSVRNGRETGVDCGGDCPACPAAVPTPTAAPTAAKKDKKVSRAATAYGAIFGGLAALLLGAGVAWRCRKAKHDKQSRANNMGLL